MSIWKKGRTQSLMGKDGEVDMREFRGEINNINYIICNSHRTNKNGSKIKINL